MKYSQEHKLYEEMKAALLNTAQSVEEAYGNYAKARVETHDILGECKDGFVPYHNGGVLANVYISAFLDNALENSLGIIGDPNDAYLEHSAALWEMAIENVLESFPEAGEADFNMMAPADQRRDYCLKLAKEMGDKVSKNAVRDAIQKVCDEYPPRIELGFYWRPKDENPFRVFAAINFDAPYYRTQSEIERTCPMVEGKTYEFLLAEESDEWPISIADFEGRLKRVVEKAFPELAEKPGLHINQFNP